MITGAADDDPSGISTYSVAGAAYGYATLWIALLTFPLMVAIQLMCARLAMVTGRGLGAAVRIEELLTCVPDPLRAASSESETRASYALMTVFRETPSVRARERVEGSCALAGSLPPKPVSPVVHAGVTYSEEGDGRAGYVAATETSTGKELWKAKVFTVHIKFWMEEDVQRVFITDLNVDSNALLIRDEKSRCYRLDLDKKRVKKDICY